MTPQEKAHIDRAIENGGYYASYAALNWQNDNPKWSDAAQAYYDARYAEYRGNGRNLMPIDPIATRAVDASAVPLSNYAHIVARGD